MSRGRRFACVLAACAALGGCGSSGSEKKEAGRLLFAETGCMDCHSLADAGASSQVGPNLDQLKPSTAAVIDQVLKGGNGMPSFKGKLTKEELTSLAAYVSQAASKSKQTVAAAFRPDKTEVSECAGKGTPGCYQQAFGNLVLNEGVKPALRVLEKELQAARLAPGACHRVLHFVGAAAVARYRGEVAPALAQGDAICASGYYHGVVERGFAGVKRAEMPQRAREMCIDPSITKRAYEHFQCLHGLGHGLMLQTNYDLPFALRACEGLGDYFPPRSCASGVFMENFASSYGVRSKYLRKDDPVYPCNWVAERHKYPCYEHATISVLRAVRDDLDEASEVCKFKSEPDWVNVCFQSLGRDVASVYARSSRHAMRLCAVADNFEGECHYGVARYFANDDGTPGRAARFCLAIQKRYRARCFVGLGVMISSFDPMPADRKRTCRRVAGVYEVACRKGAGVWTG